MADPAQPSTSARSAARYLRMMGVTRRRPGPQHTPTNADPMPPAPQVDPDEVTDESIDWAQAFREGPQGMGPDMEVRVDEPAPDSWATSLRDSYGAELEREARDRTIRETGLVPLRDEDDLADLRRDAMEQNHERQLARAEVGRRHLLRQGMSFDDPRVAETFMNDAERQHYRDPNRERPSMLTSAVRGFAQGVSGNSADEATGTAYAPFTGRDVGEERERWQQAYEDAEMENPTSYDLGQAAAIIPALFSRGGIQGALSDFVGEAPSVTERAIRAGAVGAGLGGYTGAMSSRAPLLTEATLDRGVSGAIGGAALGTGGSLIGEGLASLAARGPSAAQRLDEYAAPIRVRSAGVRSLPQMREMDELPGGYEEIAPRLDRTGIMPRGRMLDTIDDATARAEAVERRGAQAIGDTFAGVRNASASDTAQFGVSNRDAVSLEPVAQSLDAVAQHYASIPGAQHQAELAAGLAAEYRGLGDVSFEHAQAIKEFLDDEINWRPTSDISSRLAPIQASLRDARRALVSQMDATVGSELGGEGLSRYQGGRSDYQMGRQFGALGRDSELRDAVNRKVSLTDYLMAGGVGATIGSTAGPLGGVAGATVAMGANRYLRPREDAIAAGAAERLADALRWVASSSSRIAPAARSLSLSAAHNPEALRMAILALQRDDPEQFRELDDAVRQAPEPQAPTQEQQELEQYRRDYGLDADAETEEQNRRLAAEYGL